MTSLLFTLAAAAATSAPQVSEVFDGANIAAQPWHVQMVSYAVTLGLVVTTLGMFMCIYRVIKGPHISDRALGVDTLGVHLIALVVLLSLKFQTLIFFDGILVLSLVGFAGGVAMAQYIGRVHWKKVKDPLAFNPTQSQSQTNPQSPSTDAQ